MRTFWITLFKTVKRGIDCDFRCDFFYVFLLLSGESRGNTNQGGCSSAHFKILYAPPRFHALVPSCWVSEPRKVFGLK